MKNFLVIRFKNVLVSVFLITCLVMLTIAGNFVVNEIIEVSTEGRLLPIYSVETEDKMVALTFDCAWGADDIASILDVLEKNDVYATFFTVGTWVAEHEDSVKLLSDADMEIGNHSNSHAHVNRMSYDANISDMKECNEKIEAITREKVKYYRGPYGEYNNTVISAAESLNMQVIQWDVDTLDYIGKTPDEMCQRIKSKIKNGSIILMHNDTKYTASGLQQIIDCIKSEGYEIVPLNFLVPKDNYIVNHEGRVIVR